MLGLQDSRVLPEVHHPAGPSVPGPGQDPGSGRVANPDHQDTAPAVPQVSQFVTAALLD